MSQEDVEIVRAFIGAYNRGDWDAVLTDAAPGFEFDLSRAVGPLHGVYRLDQMRPFLDDFANTWESVRIEGHEFIEAGEHVVTPLTMHARGRDGIEVPSRVTWVFTIRDGALVRMCMYQQRQDAFEAVGLEEQAMSREQNVEIVRAAIDAFNRGDVGAALKDAASSFEYDFSRAVGPQRGVYSLDQMGGFLDELAEPWESVRYEADEFIEAGEHVVAPFTSHHRGREGIEVQARAAWVWTIRDGSIARVCFYQERHEALEAVGLRE